MALLYKLAVKINLVVETGFHIFSLSVYSTEVHVKQIGGAVDVECARRYAESLLVNLLFVCIACTCKYKHHLIAAYILLNTLY